MKLLPEWIQAVSAVVTAGAALYAVRSGLDTWKRNRIWDLEAKVARRYMNAALQLREGVKHVRNPFIPMAEMIEAHGGDQSKLEDRKATDRAVYNKRWDRVQRALTGLDAVLLEAETLWGKEALEVQLDLRKLVLMDLGKNLRRFLSDYSEDIQKVERDVLYASEPLINPLVLPSHTVVGKRDEYSEKIEKAIEKMKTYLKPKLEV